MQTLQAASPRVTVRKSRKSWTQGYKHKVCMKVGRLCTQRKLSTVNRDSMGDGPNMSAERARPALKHDTDFVSACYAIGGIYVLNRDHKRDIHMSVM